MTGFQLVRQEMQNGGILHSTMLLPWLELVFLVSLMPWPNLDGIFLVSFSTFILQRLSRIFFFEEAKFAHLNWHQRELNLRP